MPIPAPQILRGCAATAVPAGSPGSVSLPVLSVKPTRPRKSRMGPWRTAVLILVQLAIAGHIALWLITGMRPTLSPVEPSEAMYTLEKGLVNAGFVFFALAILSTFILGRFFCGWGCHIVALQDLCTWIMNRCGVRPKPFRSRLLVWAPLLLAAYMFVWPTFRRELLKPALLALGWWTDDVLLIMEDSPPPVFRSAQAVQGFFQPAFTKADFWETFPPWFIAIPFLLICGFAAVYFLGSKGYCTYGCPYGGIFGPADRLAPGRIRVTDACEHCGHCTAACTSNVRVHEEVRDYGMVVDPGCMKCMDCVSVCPNDALYFGFGPPAIAAKPRPGAPKRFKARIYDLSPRQEWALAGLFLLLFLAYRGVAYSTPVLLVMGLAAVVCFLTWKLWQTLREPSVRIQSLQLKLKGRLRTPGLVFGIITTLFLAAALWAGAVKLSRLSAGILDNRASRGLAYETVFAAAYQPTPDRKALAQRSIRLYRFASAPRDGGIGWPAAENLRRMAWMAAVAGDLDRAEAFIRRAIQINAPHPSAPIDDLIAGLGQTSMIRGRTPEQFAALLTDVLAESPRAASARLTLANLQLSLKQPEAAAENAARAARDHKHIPRSLAGASRILVQAGHPDRGAQILETAIRRHPRDAGLRADYAVALAHAGRFDDALPQATAACDLDARNPEYPLLAADILQALGRPDQARQYRDQAAARQAAQHPPPR
jgi:polyferredoxin